MRMVLLIFDLGVARQDDAVTLDGCPTNSLVIVTITPPPVTLTTQEITAVVTEILTDVV